MKTELNLHDFGSYAWRAAGDVRIVGPLLPAEESSMLACATDGGCDEKALAEVLGRLRSFFAAVFQGGEKVVIVADHAASFPLYYSIVDGVLRVSDEAHWCSRSGLADPLGVAMFESSFVTSGDTTLWSDVREVEAGTYVAIDQGGRAQVRRWWKGARAFSDTLVPMDAPKRAAEDLFSDVMDRLSDVPLVVPLTAGTDSRMIALMLKEAGHGDVRTFSMGRQGDADVIAGRDVAQALGFPWVHIDPNCTGGFTAVMNNREEFDGVLLHATRGGRISHFRMYCSVRLLEVQGYLPEGAVFVPGHCGMVEGGELKHVPHFERGLKTRRAAAIIRLLESRIGDPDAAGAKAIESAYAKWLPAGPRTSFEELAQAADSIHLHDYGMKFCANDIRNYEKLGYGWYMPLMDRKWCDFWLERAFGDAAGKRLETRLENEIGKKYGLSIEHYKPYTNKRRYVLKSDLRAKKAMDTVLSWKDNLDELDGYPSFFSNLDPRLLRHIRRDYRYIEKMNRALMELTELALVNHGLLKL